MVEIVRLHLAQIAGFNQIPVHGFVIKHPSAGAILVDTGVGWGNERLIKEWRVVNRRAADALAEHDLSPADVKIVINSHLHFDHCGQNAVFKHAPFYIQRSELDRARREDSSSEWFDFAGARYELLDGDAEIADGVRVVATPGHTVGHQSVFVDTAPSASRTRRVMRKVPAVFTTPVIRPVVAPSLNPAGSLPPTMLHRRPATPPRTATLAP